jgi:hypothetical protein
MYLLDSTCLQPPPTSLRLSAPAVSSFSASSAAVARVVTRPPRSVRWWAREVVVEVQARLLAPLMVAGAAACERVDAAIALDMLLTPCCTCTSPK